MCVIGFRDAKAMKRLFPKTKQYHVIEQRCHRNAVLDRCMAIDKHRQVPIIVHARFRYNIHL